MANDKSDSGGVHGRRTVATVGLALASMLLFLAMVFDDVSELTNASWSTLPIGLIARYLIAMGLGGAIAGHFLYGLFGRSGILGWFFAIAGGVVAATFAGLVGSAIGLSPDLLSDGFQSRDIIAISAGVLVLPFALIGWPVLMPIWVILIAAIHVFAVKKV